MRDTLWEELPWLRSVNCLSTAALALCSVREEVVHVYMYILCAGHSHTPTPFVFTVSGGEPSGINRVGNSG